MSNRAESKPAPDPGRCPICESGFLNTPRILVKRTRRTSETLPFRVCWRCKVVILGKRFRHHDWKVWSGKCIQTLED